MIIYSHSKQSDGGVVYGSKELLAHINGVLDKAFFHYSPGLDLGISDDALMDFLKTIVMFHDLGKYTSYFQHYLLNKKPIDHELKQHARIGGIAAYNFFKEKDEKQALLALYLIFLHHSRLIDIQQISATLNNNLQRIMALQQQDLTRKIVQIQQELAFTGLAEMTNYPDEMGIRRGFKIWSIRQASIKDYFLVNYLFSLLIEADKLDASDTVPYVLKNMDDDCVDARFGKPSLNDAIHPLDQLSNNELRNFCRASVIANLQRPDILSRYLFTLTAPTGIGKTMTALDFAVKLKAKLRAEQTINARIIYALPFINIIEQALKEYRQTLPAHIEVLGHYQYADLFGNDEDELRNEDGAEPHYNQRLMALDTWQCDIVITSFVQFFETLIGNRNKLLKKFNHYAHAIIILDEVQTLRLDQMPLIGATLFFLTKFLKSRVILMTATKPKILDLAQQQILSKQNEKADALELLARHEDVFAAFQRTKIVPLLDVKFDGQNASEDFVQEVFSLKWQSNKSCLIVCNTVKRSIELYNAVVTYLEQQGLENDVAYLSTNIIPVHRFERIKSLREMIDSGRVPILIATQVVEAGVDLDFDVGFRDVGPIDSIIQVAGRINRNNHPDKHHAPLYIVDFGDCRKIYGSMTYDQAVLALQQSDDFFEVDYLSLINNYFEAVADRKSFSQFNKVFESMGMLRYDSERKEDRPVSCFRIIEETQSTQAVFIELGEEEIMLGDKYRAKIKGLITKEDFDKHFKLKFQQRIISVPDYLTQDLPFINEFDEHLKVVSHSFLNQYYHEKTGFIREDDAPITFF